MDGFKEVVFDSAQRVVAGSYVALFKPNEPRFVNEELYRAAMAMGGQVPQTEAPLIDPPQEPVKRRRRRKAKPKIDQQAELTPSVVEFIENNQDKWDHAQDYDMDGVPRISLFKDSFPELDSETRDIAWAIYVDSKR